MHLSRIQLTFAALVAAVAVALAIAAQPAHAQTPDGFAAGDSARVDAEGSCLHLRGGPGLDHAVHDCLVHGEPVTILGDSQPAGGYTWLQVETSSTETGWVAAEYLVVEAEESANHGSEDHTEGAHNAGHISNVGTVDTPGSCLNFRVAAGLDQRVGRCLAHGTTVTVVDQQVTVHDHIWLHVSLDNGETGWVATDFVSFGDEEAEAEGDRQVIGASVEGREIEAYTVGTGPRTVLLIGGLHAGPESETTDLVQALMGHYLGNADAVPDELTLVFVPSVNPDGLAAGTRLNARGVDLNRNWPASNWSPTAVAGTTEVSGGTEPLSEPETQAVYDLITELQPLFTISYHGYASVIQDNGSGVANTLTQVYANASSYEHILDWVHYDITGELIETLKEMGLAAADVELEQDDALAIERNLRGLQATLEAAAALQ